LNICVEGSGMGEQLSICVEYLCGGQR